MGNFFSAATLVSFGVLEGYAITMSGIISPLFFRDQMTFASFEIMKFFLGCVGSSMFFQGLMRLAAPRRFDSTRIFANTAIPYWRSMSGCFVLGLGMYVGGTGPTIIGAQMGMGLSSAPYIFAGAIAGGAAYGILETRLGLKPSPAGNWRELSMDGKLGVKYESIAIPAGISLLGVAYQLERLFPHAPEAAKVGVPLFTMSPLWSSLVVGMNQVPIRIIKKTGQGGSTAIMTLISTLSGGSISPAHKVTKLADAYQFLFVYVGVGIGAWLMCRSTPGYIAPKGYPPLASAGGAFLALFGARFAQGCTCGHGVTGMSELSLSSIAAAMSIFAGGICAGILHNGLWK